MALSIRIFVFCAVTSLSLFAPTLRAAGIPIIDGSKIAIAVQEEVKARINQKRKEVMAQLEQSTSFQIGRDQKASDDQVAANKASRITGALADTHNNRMDAATAPYMDACAAISTTRTTASSKANTFYQQDLPRQTKAFTRPDQNPELGSLRDAIDRQDVDNPGLAAERLSKRIREWDRSRLSALDEIIVEVGQDDLAFSRVYQSTVSDNRTAQQVAFMRHMLLGSGLSRSTLNFVPNQADNDIRSREMVEEGRYQAFRSSASITAAVMNDQTTVVEDEHLPLEGLVEVMASAERLERLSVNSTNDPRLMTDRAMLQSMALSKAANLVALLREYERGKVDLMNQILVVLQQDGRYEGAL